MVKDDQTIWKVLKFQSSADGEGWRAGAKANII